MRFAGLFAIAAFTVASSTAALAGPLDSYRDLSVPIDLSAYVGTPKIPSIKVACTLYKTTHQVRAKVAYGDNHYGTATTKSLMVRAFFTTADKAYDEYDCVGSLVNSTGQNDFTSLYGPGGKHTVAQGHLGAGFTDPVTTPAISFAPPADAPPAGLSTPAQPGAASTPSAAARITVDLDLEAVVPGEGVLLQCNVYPSATVASFPESHLMTMFVQKPYETMSLSVLVVAQNDAQKQNLTKGACFIQVFGKDASGATVDKTANGTYTGVHRLDFPFDPANSTMHAPGKLTVYGAKP